jgi:hypothetical protein
LKYQEYKAVSVIVHKCATSTTEVLIRYITAIQGVVSVISYKVHKGQDINVWSKLIEDISTPVNIVPVQIYINPQRACELVIYQSHHIATINLFEVTIYAFI